MTVNAGHCNRRVAPPLQLRNPECPPPRPWAQANYLRSVGVKKGDAVCIYLPMIAELPIAMLACARIGAVHSVVFAGFSSESLAQRIEDCKSNVLLTCNGEPPGRGPSGSSPL